MIAYKLLRKMKDGQLAPLFINKTSRTPIGEWMPAEFHPTKGYAERKGWHCCLEPNAPHLSEKDRVWCEVEVEDYEYFDRPESQGGTWVLAQKMKIIKELRKPEHHRDTAKYADVKVGEIVDFDAGLFMERSENDWIQWDGGYGVRCSNEEVQKWIDG